MCRKIYCIEDEWSELLMKIVETKKGVSIVDLRSREINLNLSYFMVALFLFAYIITENSYR
jgi:hypothetical protein